jgi:dipeptidyl aminopeptidase/acylaminoacyl peptidase
MQDTCATAGVPCGWIATFAVAAILAPAASFAQAGSSSERVAAPLPLDVIVSLRSHAGRDPVNLSPDGEWIAHTIEADERLPRGSSPVYTSTGFPLFEGNARKEATLSRTDGNQQISLGIPGSSSWSPVWSPRGDRVAFYSDDGDAAGLRVWDRSSGESRRLGKLIVRPAFGFEAPRWSSDGERLLVEVLPEGVTIAEANAPSVRQAADRSTMEVGPDALAVVVRRSEASKVAVGADTSVSSSSDPVADFTAAFIADLVLVDVRTGAVERIASRTRIGWYGFSPDGRHVAYTVPAGVDANAQQSLYDLRVVELVTRIDRRLAERIPLGYGVEWSWSPDGRTLAYTRSGVGADGGITLVSAGDGSSRKVQGSRASFDPGTGDLRPVWSRDGKTLYGVGDSALWRIDAESGVASELARIEGWRIRSLITASFFSPVAWSRDGGRTLWVIGRELEGGAAGIYAVDAATGRSRLALRESRSFGLAFSQAASAATGRIIVAASDQQSPGELWRFDTADRSFAQASRINAALGGYPLGEARVIHWRSTSGEPLGGSLLLPPGYKPGTRVPLVVWVYGGARGTTAVNQFGFRGSSPAFNLHVLATRGYAVLYPDAPVQTGRTTDDLVATVLPGVDAAIDQGYADSERLAIMGQSYGSANVLALLTRTTRFKAAVLSAAVSHPDLFADYLANPGFYERGQGNMGGTIWQYPERYRANSPLLDFPTIQTPILIAQGKLDGDLVASEAIFTALERLGKHVEYRVYGGESHVISGRSNVIDFWERRLAFLAENLDVRRDSAGRVSAR